jgi:hypothetical protein
MIMAVRGMMVRQIYGLFPAVATKNRPSGGAVLLEIIGN